MYSDTVCLCITYLRVGNDFSAITIIPAENHVMPSPEGQPHIEFKTVQEIRSTSPYDFPVTVFTCKQLYYINILYILLLKFVFLFMITA